MILYALDIRWNLGKITEWEVEKETAKTYTVKRKDERPFCEGRYLTETIRKAYMMTRDTKFFFSIHELKEEYKQILERGIEGFNKRIESLNDKIADYQKRLQELEVS